MSLTDLSSDWSDLIITAAMDSSNLTSLPEDTIEANQPQQAPRPLSAFASRPDRPATQWVASTFNSLAPIALLILNSQWQCCCCRSSSQKFAPLDWKDYFDKEDDIPIPDSDDVSVSRILNTSASATIITIFCLLMWFYHFRFFMYIWQEQRVQLCFAYMEVVTLGMFNFWSYCFLLFILSWNILYLVLGFKFTWSLDWIQ